MHPQVQHSAPRVDVSKFERAELLAPKSMVEQDHVARPDLRGGLFSTERLPSFTLLRLLTLSGLR
jgi:hypothetical protein